MNSRRTLIRRAPRDRPVQWAAVGIIVFLVVGAGLPLWLDGCGSDGGGSGKTIPPLSSTGGDGNGGNGEATALFPIPVSLLYGYIDLTGKVVVKPTLTTAADFSEGLAFAQKEEFGPVGIIDATGAWIDQPKYGNNYFSIGFSEGLAAVWLQEGQAESYFDENGALIEASGPMGYIDSTGAWVIEPQLCWAGDFSEGLAAVQPEKDGMCGYLDSTGAYVIEPQFAYATRFSEGLAAVQPQEDGPWGYVDRTGTLVIEAQFAYASDFSDGLAPVQPQKDGPWGYIDQTGTVVVEPQYVWASEFSEDLGIVRTTPDGPYGYIDRAGTLVIPAKFTHAGDFSLGLAAVSERDEWGYIDTTGNYAIRGLWGAFEFYPQGVAKVERDFLGGGWAYIDTSGDVIWDSADE